MSSKNDKAKGYDKPPTKKVHGRSKSVRPPRPRRDRGRMLGLRRHKRGVLLILLFVAAAVGSFLTYGYVYGANVTFTFGEANQLRQSYQLVAMSTFHNMPSTIDITHILIRNSGSTGITVLVGMHAVNAVLSVSYYGPYTDSVEVQMYLPAGGGFQVQNFYLTLPLQVASFTLSITVAQVLDFSSVSALATSSLATLQPTAPTTLVYTQKLEQPIIYQLTQQY